MGKSIGGTVGAPYEWDREFDEVTGFTSEAGTMIPNDDLDLQLIWLLAMEIEGPKGINPAVLGEYWITNIPPYWNEYGVGKANLKEHTGNHVTGSGCCTADADMIVIAENGVSASKDGVV